MKIQAALTTLLLLVSAASFANPTVSGATISWPNNGWYQILSESDYSEVCAEASACTVGPGSYLVINHTTGERFPNIIVQASSNPVNVVDDIISWPDDGWYQVQNLDTFESVCEGCFVESTKCNSATQQLSNSATQQLIFHPPVAILALKI